MQNIERLDIINNMKNAEKLIEIEALLENITKHYAKNNLLRFKFLYFVNQYENLSVGMIISKLGIKKSNFALMSKKLEEEGVVEIRQGELDKRIRKLFLTEKGKEQLKKYIADINKFFADFDPQVDNSIEQLNYYLNKKV